MKFLFDQSADFRLIAHLRKLGHDVSAVSREHPSGPEATLKALGTTCRAQADRGYHPVSVMLWD
jgi:hypothetical protein